MSRIERDRRVVAKLTDELGPIIMAALSSPDVVEIMLNPDGQLWVETFTSGMEVVGEISAPHAELIISTVAHSAGTTVTRDRPVVSAELPIDGSRFEGIIPPNVSRPIFSIRRKAIKVFQLEDYVAQGVLTAHDAVLLRTAIAERRNILICGGTGSGKTTLANALIAEISVIHPDHRLVIIEDTAEIQSQAKNVVIMRTSDDVSMLQLLRSTMRIRPDRIIVGEVRGGEALALLKGWNTGHPGGISTVHANDAASALDRLEQLIGEVTPTPMSRLIAEAVDLVVSIQRAPRGRVVNEIIDVTGWSGGGYVTRSIKGQKEILNVA